MNDDECRDLEYLCKACRQTAITVGGLFTDTGINESGDELMINDEGENYKEVRTVSRVKRWRTDRSTCKQTKVEMIGERGIGTVLIA